MSKKILNQYNFNNIFELGYFKLANLMLPYFVNTSVTPNQITFVSGMFGVMAAMLLVVPSYYALFTAALFIHIYSVFDSLDGQLAKAKKMSSPYGMWLDIFFDKLNDFLLIVGLTLGAYNNTLDSYFLMCGLLLMGFVFSMQLLLVINDFVLKDVRNDKSENIADDGCSDNYGAYYRLFRVKLVWIFSNHLALRHNSFLFFVAIFAMLNMLESGLVFMTIYSGVSLLYGLIINFIKIS